MIRTLITYHKKNMSCNSENCTCPNVECVRHGKCCECINNHMKNGITVYCMKDNDPSPWKTSKN